MKVQRTNPANLSRLQQTETGQSRGNVSGRGGGPGRGDDVQISTLSSALSARDAQSGDRAAKVVRLSDTVSSSRYQVDAQVVSAKLIQEHMRAAA
jgi:anti-sigma28 factor (negative regulator of flagellin synthesis)